MSKKMYTEEYIQAIADAIREKNKSEETYTVSEMADAIRAIGGSIEEKDVNFYDYDGTLLYAYTVDEAQELTELPQLPTHDYLTCEGWNWTLAQIKALKTFVNVGANYITTDKATRIYIEVDQDCTQTLTFGTNTVNGITIDWGDGSQTEITTSTSVTSYTHDYTVGNYTIKLIPSNDNVTVTPGQTLIGSGNNRTATKNMLKGFYCGQNVRFTEQSNFVYSGLKTIALSRTIYWDAWTLFRASELECIVIPPNKPHGKDNCFAACYNLKVFCSALGSVFGRFNLTSACSFKSFVDVDPNSSNNPNLINQYFLKRLSFAVNITTCVNRINCTNDYFAGLEEIYLLAQTEVPTYVSNFGQPYTKYYVPANLYDEWIVTTGWEDIADRIIAVEV